MKPSELKSKYTNCPIKFMQQTSSPIVPIYQVPISAPHYIQSECSPVFVHSFRCSTINTNQPKRQKAINAKE